MAGAAADGEYVLSMLCFASACRTRMTVGGIIKKTPN